MTDLNKDGFTMDKVKLEQRRCGLMVAQVATQMAPYCSDTIMIIPLNAGTP